MEQNSAAISFSLKTGHSDGRYMPSVLERVLLKGQSPLPGFKDPRRLHPCIRAPEPHERVGWAAFTAGLCRTKPIVVVGLAQPSGGRFGVFQMDMAVEGMSQPLGSGCVPLSHMGQGPCPL